MKFTLRSKKRAITLIEVLIDGAIIAIVATTVIYALLGSLRTATHSAEVATAGQVANAKLELLRNMSYDALATEHGPIIPQGDILDSETVTRDKKTFTVTIDIRYIDDAYDGQAGGSPNDLNSADYKRITVTVLDIKNKKLVQLSSDIASRAAETDSNTGVLKITVLNATGIGVSEASISVSNTAVSPSVSIDTTTGVDGIVIIPNLPLSNQYHITATKGGYSSDSTSPITVENPHPTNPDATLLLQQVTNTTLSIDQLSSIQFTANGISGSLTVQFQGAKLIGTDPNISKVSFSQVLSSGLTTLSNIEFDSYTAVPPSGWYITSCSPLLALPISPNTTTAITCNFTADANDVRITSITPQTSDNISGVSWEIEGVNLAGASVSLQLGTDPEVPIDGMVVDEDGLSISGTVDFSSLPPGTYNVIVRNGAGKQTTQTAGLILQ